MDWDNSMKTMQWVDIRREKTSAGITSAHDHFDPDKKEPSNLSRKRTGLVFLVFILNSAVIIRS